MAYRAHGWGRGAGPDEGAADEGHGGREIRRLREGRLAGWARGGLRTRDGLVIGPAVGVNLVEVQVEAVR